MGRWFFYYWRFPVVPRTPTTFYQIYTFVSLLEFNLLFVIQLVPRFLEFVPLIRFICFWFCGFVCIGVVTVRRFSVLTCLLDSSLFFFLLCNVGPLVVYTNSWLKNIFLLPLTFCKSVKVLRLTVYGQFYLKLWSLWQENFTSKIFFCVFLFLTSINKRSSIHDIFYHILQKMDFLLIWSTIKPRWPSLLLVVFTIDTSIFIICSSCPRT